MVPCLLCTWRVIKCCNVELAILRLPELLQQLVTNKLSLEVQQACFAASNVKLAAPRPASKTRPESEVASESR